MPWKLAPARTVAALVLAAPLLLWPAQVVAASAALAGALFPPG